MTITAPLCPFNGWYKLASWFASHELHNGIDVKWNPTLVYDRYGNFKVRLPKIFTDRVSSVPSEQEVVFANASEKIRPSIPDSVIYTGIDRNQLTQEELDILKQYRRVIVSTPRHAMLLNKFGVRADVIYIPLDTSVFSKWGNRENIGRQFGAVAQADRQHEFEFILDAWFEAFPNVDGVTLQVKVEPGVKLPKTSDERIVYVHDWMQPYQLAQWYSSLDCFLSANGNRWHDWHAQQADACKTPTIGVNVLCCSSPVKYCPSTKHHLPVLPQFVDKMRLAYYDPKHMWMGALLNSGMQKPIREWHLELSRSIKGEYAWPQYNDPQQNPSHSDTLATLATSSTRCQSCGG